MRRILMIAAMLSFAVSAMAVDVEITVSQSDAFDSNGVSHKTITIGYQNAAVDIRAFALELSVDNGTNIGDTALTGYKTGESTAASPGYGIFPGRFRDFVNPSNPDPCWASVNYNPSTPWADAENTGLGWPSIIVELGTLYKGDANKPGTSGTLFSFDVNSEGQPDCNLTIDVEDLRGGVVNATGTAATTNLPLEVPVEFEPPPCVVPNVVNVAEATATAAITTAGLNPVAGTPVCSATIPAGNVISTDPVADTEVVCGSDVTYVLSLGITPGVPGSITVPAADADGKYNVTWTAGAGATSYVLESSAPASGTTIYPLWVSVYSGTALTYAAKVGGGTWSYRVKSVNGGCESTPLAGGNTCVVTDCLKATAPAAERNAFVAWRYPPSWCFNRQCKGDINGAASLGKPVTTTDLGIMKSAFNQTDAVVATIPNGIGADLNHAASLGKRVTTTDLNILKSYFNVATLSVPCCDLIAPAGDCTLVATDKFAYWTTP